MKNELYRTDGTKRTIEAFLLVFFRIVLYRIPFIKKKAGILL